MAATPRLRLRPERELVKSGLAVAFMGAAALMYAANAVWLVVCLVVGLAGGGAAAAGRRLRGAAVEILPAPPFTAGLPMALPVRITAAQDVPGARLDAGGAPVDLALAAGSHAAAAPLPPLRRGIHRIAHVRLATAWPLGVLRLERRWPVDAEIVVAPAPAGDDLPPADGAGDDGRGGGGPEDFAGHRPYRPGDPPRGIDWRAAARGLGWLSTQWDGRGGGARALRYADCRGDAETRLAQLARWIEDAAARGADYGLELPGDSIPPGRGEIHRRRCLRALAAHPGAP
jgi:uncharacterized protein (DUF58 family)